MEYWLADNIGLNGVRQEALRVRLVVQRVNFGAGWKPVAGERCGRPKCDAGNRQAS